MGISIERLRVLSASLQSVAMNNGSEIEYTKCMIAMSRLDKKLNGSKHSFDQLYNPLQQAGTMHDKARYNPELRGVFSYNFDGYRSNKKHVL